MPWIWIMLIWIGIRIRKIGEVKRILIKIRMVVIKMGEMLRIMIHSHRKIICKVTAAD